MKELTEVVNGTLGLLVGGVLVASLLGSILPTLRLFFVERREARFGDYLRRGESSTRKPTRVPAVAPDSSRAADELLTDSRKQNARNPRRFYRT